MTQIWPTSITASSKSIIWLIWQTNCPFNQIAFRWTRNGTICTHENFTSMYARRIASCVRIKRFPTVSTCELVSGFPHGLGTTLSYSWLRDSLESVFKVDNLVPISAIPRFCHFWDPNFLGLSVNVYLLLQLFHLWLEKLIVDQWLKAGQREGFQSSVNLSNVFRRDFINHKASQSVQNLLLLWLLCS